MRHAATAELLEFYAQVAEYQRDLVDAAVAARRPARVEPRRFGPAQLASLIDARAIARHVPAFCDWLSARAPATLAETARRHRHDPVETWTPRFERWLTDLEAGDLDPVLGFIGEALSQPFIEVAVHDEGVPAAPPVANPAPEESVGDLSRRRARCPRCGGPPGIGLLRERGHGAGRALVCVRCLADWPAPRLVCPACGAVDVQAMPVFTSDAFAAVRLDACEACRTYLKSIDLTVDGTAIAVVDDLASLPLDLWAEAQGWRRLRASLLLR